MDSAKEEKVRMAIARLERTLGGSYEDANRALGAAERAMEATRDDLQEILED